VEPLDTIERRVGSLSVRGCLVTHTKESYAFRVATDDGAGLVYSGDVGRARDLVPLIREGDTLLIEVSFGPGPASPGAQHLDAPAVAQLAVATRPSRVLLTHLQMGFDRAETVDVVRRGWPGAVELVDPGFTTTIER
jgi:ribonuclease BN (tRNA processing enzyme)